MQGPVATYLDHGARLHLHHGPIDLIIGADGAGRTQAFEAAIARFQTVLCGLVSELPQHRTRLTPDGPAPADPVAQRMTRAARPFCADHFVTPMIAVAGAVADCILQAMVDAASLTRAYVNNGGDIAVHLAQGQTFSIAMADHAGRCLGRVTLQAEDRINGIATSGRHGRSFSFGIADSVTVLARDAATADAAATLIANAVDLPDAPGITRRPAQDLDPDSDLGARLVTTDVAPLSSLQADKALHTGTHLAQSLQRKGLITAAALFLQSRSALCGPCFAPLSPKELAHA